MPPTLEKLQQRTLYLNSYNAMFMADASDKADASCGYASDKARSIEDTLLDALLFTCLVLCLIM